MKLLIANDDGIDADGIQALFAAAEQVGEPWMIAPASHQSGSSHTVTTGKAVRTKKRGERRYAIEGTPADCVRVGLHRIVPDAKWVLSGINHGGNLGADTYYSGTVAAVREGVLHGWPGIAFSNYHHKGQPFNWPRATKLILPILKKLLAEPPERGSFWNVNLPQLGADDADLEVVTCPLDPTPLPLSYSHSQDEYLYDGDYFSRHRTPGCDVDVCFGGKISLTKVRLF